jgi:hypothetical protein
MAYFKVMSLEGLGKITNNLSHDIRSRERQFLITEGKDKSTAVHKLLLM